MIKGYLLAQPVKLKFNKLSDSFKLFTGHVPIVFKPCSVGKGFVSVFRTFCDDLGKHPVGFHDFDCGNTVK